MEEIKVSKVLNVTIMNAEGKRWGELLSLVENKLKQTKDTIMLDFENVQTPEAWKNEAFKQLVTNERVHMLVYTNKRLVDLADLMCSIDFKSTGRVKNIDVVMNGGPSIGEKKVINMYDDFMARIELAGASLIDGKSFTIPVNKIISQISTETPVKAVCRVIETLNKKYKGKYKYLIDVTNLAIAENVQKLIATELREFDLGSVEVEVLADNQMMNEIQALKLIGGEEIGYKARVEIIKKFIPENMVGILSKFRASKSSKLMSRIKEAKPMSARVAIYRGMDLKKGVMIFDTFPKNYFCKRTDYELDNDGAVLDGLHVERVAVEIMNIGVEDKSIGMLYHFNRPVQMNPNDVYMLWTTTEDGKLRKKRVSLPAYIKDVLDDHGVVYDFSKLVQAIMETRKLFEYKEE